MEENRKKILIVDDEPSIRDSLNLLLKRNFDVHLAEDGLQALESLEITKPDLVLLDVIMPNLDGIETLRQLRERSIKVPVVMLTATTTVRTAVQAMKYGAVDFLSKPFDIEELTSLIVRTLDEHPNTDKKNGENSISTQNKIAKREGDFGEMIGTSPQMLSVYQQITQIAERDTTVLITGESGVGKEVVARRIHELSPRAEYPFVAINCAAIPETLIESELFGHERGAFTHAIERRIGHFELADKGTLFLDEIGELSLAVQVKMLRFLQEQEFYRVGRSKPIKVNVRILTATNKSLEDLILEKKFRPDLYYRLNVVNLQIPSLKYRGDDIERLLKHFTEALAPKYGGKNITFSNEALEVLKQYSWPGNVRELENIIESLLALAKEGEIREEDLPSRIRNMPQESLKMNNQSGMQFEEAEKQFETEMILKALRRTNYVQTRAAEVLGISRRILKYKMDKLGISDKLEKNESAPEAIEDIAKTE